MSASKDRDRAIERLLHQSFKAPTGPSDACVDAETLAAWADGGLSGALRATVESHVADCARCQAIVSTAARIEAIAPARAEPRPRRWVAWLVPLTAAAAAIAIWVAVPRGPGAGPSQVAENQSQAAQAKTSEASQPTAELQQSPAAREKQAPAAKSDQPRRDQAEASALSKDSDRRELDLLKQESQSANAAADAADKRQAAAEPGVSAPAAAPPAAPPPPSPVARETLQERSANSAAQKAAPGGVIASIALPRSLAYLRHHAGTLHGWRLDVELRRDRSDG